MIYKFVNRNRYRLRVGVIKQKKKKLIVLLPEKIIDFCYKKVHQMLWVFSMYVLVGIFYAFQLKFGVNQGLKVRGVIVKFVIGANLSSKKDRMELK